MSYSSGLNVLKYAMCHAIRFSLLGFTFTQTEDLWQPCAQLVR